MPCLFEQGDGTAFIFQDRPEVFTLSMHGEGNFPARKQRSNLDVGLPDGATDAHFLRCAIAACHRNSAAVCPATLTGCSFCHGARCTLPSVLEVAACCLM